MGLVDITEVSRAFFITTALFIVMTLSFLSLAFVTLVNNKKKNALVYFVLGISAAITYGILVLTWLQDTM
ncbi:MAG: hypothetical protein RLZZ267_1375 [Bacillota bacterium]